MSEEFQACLGSSFCLGLTGWSLVWLKADLGSDHYIILDLRLQNCSVISNSADANIMSKMQIYACIKIFSPQLSILFYSFTRSLPTRQ